MTRRTPWIVGLLLLALAAGGCQAINAFENTETHCTVCDCLAYQQGYRETAGRKIKVSDCANGRCKHARSVHAEPDELVASQDDQHEAVTAADSDGS